MKWILVLLLATASCNPTLKCVIETDVVKKLLTESKAESKEPESEFIKKLRKQNAELLTENTLLQTAIMEKNRTINNLLRVKPNVEGSPLRSK